MYLALGGGPPIFTQDFTCPMLLTIRLPKKSHGGNQMFIFVYEAFALYGLPFPSSSTNKHRKFHPRAGPVSLAATKGIVPNIVGYMLLSLPPVTKMIQFAGFPPYT